MTVTLKLYCPDCQYTDAGRDIDLMKADYARHRTECEAR